MSSLCHSANLHWLSILYMVTYMFPCYSLNLLHPLPPSKEMATHSSVDLFFPEAVLKQDTLLLYNPKECRGEKKVCPFFLLENSRPLSPWGPLDFLSICLGSDSLIPPFLLGELCCQGKGASFSLHNYFLLFRGMVPKLLRQHIFLTLILRVSDPGPPSNSWRRKSETPDHDCSQFLTLNYAAQEGLMDTPLDNPDMEIFRWQFFCLG